MYFEAPSSIHASCRNAAISPRGAQVKSESQRKSPCDAPALSMASTVPCRVNGRCAAEQMVATAAGPDQLLSAAAPQTAAATCGHLATATKPGTSSGSRVSIDD